MVFCFGCCFFVCSDLATTGDIIACFSGVQNSKGNHTIFYTLLHNPLLFSISLNFQTRYHYYLQIEAYRSQEWFLRANGTDLSLCIYNTDLLQAMKSALQLLCNYNVHVFIAQHSKANYFVIFVLCDPESPKLPISLGRLIF